MEGHERADTMKSRGNVSEKGASAMTGKNATTWDELAQRRPLPVHFRLYASRRPNKALCAALTVELRGIVAIRILDPEHREPYVSVCSLFAMAGLSLIEGLLRFGLQRDKLDYDVTLAGLEPREAIWTSLQLARNVARDLSLESPLALLLSWDLRHAWTLDEGDAGLTHNWRIPPKYLDAGRYSTGSLLGSPWPTLQLLAPGQHVRTLVSNVQRAEANSSPVGISAIISEGRFDQAQVRLRAMERRLVRWTIRAHDAYLDAIEPTSDQGDNEDFHENGADDQKEEEKATPLLYDSLAQSNSTITIRDLASWMQDLSSMLLLPSPPSLLSSASVSDETTRELLSIPPASTMSKGKRTTSQQSQSNSAQELARVHLALAHHLWLQYRLLTESLARPRGMDANATSDTDPIAGSTLDLGQEFEREASKTSSAPPWGTDTDMEAKARLARIEQATTSLLAFHHQQHRRAWPPNTAAATSAGHQSWRNRFDVIRQQQSVLLIGVIFGLVLSRLFA